MISNDTSIQRNVENVLKNNRLLRNADIKIETRNGEVTLYGFVDVLAEKWAAGAAVAQVPGVTSVDNSLTVAVDGPIDDRDIGEGVREKFCAADRNDLHELTAEVNGGVVYIRGQAASLAVKNAAIMAAAGVPGVKDVVTIVEIGSDGLRSDDASITNRVERALAGTESVSAALVGTDTDDGTVTLSGTVWTPEQAEIARQIASAVPGVAKVDNELETVQEEEKYVD